MTDKAINQVTAALRRRLEVAVGADQVYVGPPVAEDVGDRKLALFLFHILPNQAMRNDTHFVPASTDPRDPFVEVDAIPLDLRFLVSAFRASGAGRGGPNDPNEMLNLGAAIHQLHAQPNIDGSEIPHQLARITPEPYTMEDISRVWSLMPQTSYQTSLVYLVSPVYVSLDPPPAPSRVTVHEYRHGAQPTPTTSGGTSGRAVP